MNMTTNTSNSHTWYDKLSQALLREPKDKSELIHLLRKSEQNKLFDTDTLSMLESVILLSELQARDIMIPKQQMVVVPEDIEFKALLKAICESGHSRFPVMAENKDEIVGILHSKDLFPFCLDNNLKFNLGDLLRPVTFIPESKRLNLLLNEFRLKRNHMAIVVDEYGVNTGFITIEDIIEQIVGDIEDEFDIDEDAYVKKHGNNKYIIKAHMPIEDFNEYFSLNLKSESYDTLSGLITKTYGHRCFYQRR